MLKAQAIAILLSIISVQEVHSLNNGLGRKPPMGWNSWNKFRCDISEDTIRFATDRMIELGLYKVGYNFVNIDDCWNLKERDSKGHQ